MVCSISVPFSYFFALGETVYVWRPSAVYCAQLLSPFCEDGLLHRIRLLWPAGGGWSYVAHNNAVMQLILIVTNNPVEKVDYQYLFFF